MIADQIQARELFLQALERSLPADREAFLRSACGVDTPLRREVDCLLKAHASPASLLEHGVLARTTPPLNEQPGTHIGPYKLLEQIGEGGMGVVYVAEQTEPVRRRVALKIIKPGMDTRLVIARFEAERQALAMMDHPHIAKVFDAGTTDAGRPYFVMELVRGLPVTEYCDKARLSPRQRLALFIDVCHAVQHAHQKGVIHRDLKPSNVMITVHDGRPVAKVIDFGVAKAVGQQLTERTVYTAHTQLVGTPLYMSPEQADFSSQDVDTRSDVYSLGVLLYELLTGQTPFDKETLTKAGFDEMRRIIREDEPPCPSRRFSTLSAQAISTVSQHRSVDERQLGRVLRGEVDWIVMKALEKDRSRRYESASALAADIQRYLSDEPVLACPPTTMYRFQKFARKHKPAIAAGLAITLCLILGTTVSAWQAVRATQAEAQANAKETQAKEAAAAEAQQRQRAESNERKANAQRDEVQILNHKLERTLYTAHLNLAQRAWESGAADRVRELLDRHRPQAGQTDLRGFEWYYLHRLCHSDLLSIRNYAERVVYSPDGTRIAGTVGYAGVSVWDSQTGSLLRSFSDHHALRAAGVAFSPDGGLIASSRVAFDQGRRSAGDLKVWEVETGKEVVRLNESAPVPTLAFSLDGKYLATGSMSAVKIWNVQAGEVRLVLKGIEGDVYHVAFSPQGERLVASGGSFSNPRVIIWSVETGDQLLDLKGHGLHVRSVAFSPDGKRLLTASADHTAKVWDARTGDELLALKGHLGALNHAAYSSDGQRIASSSEDRTVRIWDADSGQELFVIRGHDGNVGSVAFSPDGKSVAIPAGGFIKIWDANKSQESVVLKDADATNVRRVVLSPDQTRLASAAGQIVRLWDARVGQAALLLKHDNPKYDVRTIAFSPNGKLVATGGSRGSDNAGKPLSADVKIWDTETGREIHTLSGHTADINQIAFSSDSRRIATASMDKTVKIWDADSGKEVLTYRGHGLPVFAVTFSSDGRRMASATGGYGGDVMVWDSQTGDEHLAIPAGLIWSLRFSPDDKRLATSVSNGVIGLWDAASGEQITQLKGHTARAEELAFSPDGKRLASASADRTVKIWDMEAGEELLTLTGHANIVRHVAFTSDGHRLISASADGTARIWDATPVNDDVVIRHASLSRQWRGGWIVPPAPGYERGFDPAVRHGGKNSAFVRSMVARQEDSGGMLQSFRADEYRGKRLRLSSFIKTESVEQSANMWMRIDGEMKALGFDNMHDRPLTGTTDWKKCEIVLDVPQDSVNIFFGFFLIGKGQAWADDFQFEVVTNEVSTTKPSKPGEPRKQKAVPARNRRPVNLDFES